MKECTVHITEFTPIDTENWNALCLSCSNFFQTTYYDEVNNIFKNVPVYFQVKRSDHLSAGLKIYIYQNTRILLKSMSRQAHAFAEPIVDSREENKEQILSFLAAKVMQYLNETGCNYFKSKSVYGEPCIVFDADNKKEKTVLFAYISLHQRLDQLWAGIYKTHQRYIKKAQKCGLEFVVEDNFEAFHALLMATYAGQKIIPPSKAYLLNLYHTARRYDAAELCFVKNNELYLSAVMAIRYGKKVEYMHGGMQRNMLGSGHLIHWEMMQRYKAASFEAVGFGQVGEAIDANTKMETVSDFKIKFGCNAKQSVNTEIVFRPSGYKLYRMLQKLQYRWKR